MWLSAAVPSDSATAQALCLACGLCCNGVIFADVRLQPGDNADRLRDFGLALRPIRQAAGRQDAGLAPSLRFAQPCILLRGCKCRAYDDRPRHCRDFECVVLRSLKAGTTSPRAALEVVREARQRAGNVVRLLRELNDSREDRPLSSRFKQMQKRFDRNGNHPNAEALDSFAALTLAVHYLNLAIGEAFYPGDTCLRGPA